jgi:hypothetical protein
MAPGALDPLMKELIYIAVSITSNCMGKGSARRERSDRRLRLGRLSDPNRTVDLNN